MHLLAVPGRVAPIDPAGVTAPASGSYVATIIVVGEQPVGLSAAVQDVPVKVKGVGVDDIAPTEALYAVALEIAYPLVDRVVPVGALTGEVPTAYLVNGHRRSSDHQDAQHHQPKHHPQPAHLLSPFVGTSSDLSYMLGQPRRAAQPPEW